MRIVLIAPTTLPARRANTLQVMKMAQAIQNLGHDVHLLSPDYSRKPQEHGNRDWPSLARHYGLQNQFNVEWLPANPSIRSYDYALSAVRKARALRADLIYTRLPQAAALASVLAMPCVFEIHDVPQGRIGPSLLRWFLRGRGARRLVVITQALLADLKGRFDLREDRNLSLVAPDGVDLARFANLPEPARARGRLFATYGLRLPENAIVAGYTGHLYAGRGGDTLLSLAQRLAGVHFLIVGGDPQDVIAFKEKALALGLKNLTLTGFVPNQELPAFQAACDILLMPYQRQVMASSGGDIGAYLSPMKLFEYLACGRAILSGDLPVLHEVLNETNSILLPPDDVDAWETAIRELARNPHRRTALAARARLDASYYTWEARVTKILEFPTNNAKSKS